MSSTNLHRKDDDSVLLDLDDHRTQRLSSNPRNEEVSPVHVRRGTFASVRDEPTDSPRADRLEVPGLSTRDFGEFESAIVDDEADVNRLQAPRDNTSALRRSTFRRQRPNVSRDSSSSRSDSSSPPNSVHAFAEQSRLRGRANTAERAPSVELARTASNSTHPNRRGTMSSQHSVAGRLSSESTDSSVENDVCYPQGDHISTAEGKFDFEELDEYVQEFERSVPMSSPFSPATIQKRNSEPIVPVTLPDAALATSDSNLDDEKAQVQPQPAPSRAATIHTKAPEHPKPFFTFFSSEFEDTIHSNSLSGLLSDGENFERLFDNRNNGGTWWLDVQRPTEDLVGALCKAFGVHPLTREDITTQESREKVELFDNYYFVAFRSFENDDKNSDTYLEPISVYCVVFRYGCLTFSYSQNTHTTSVLRRIGKLRDHMHLSADWICYALIDDIVDFFMPVIHEIEVEVDTIEDSVFTAHYEDARPILKAIGDARKRVMVLVRLIGGKADVIKGFAKRCNEQFSVAPRGDVGLYLSDILDHIITMRDNLAHSEQLLSRVHNNFLAQINVDSINHGNKVNGLLGKITLVATIVVPMNLITGLFGMNVHVPGQGGESFAWFFGIAGVIVALCVCAFLFMKRMRLI